MSVTNDEIMNEFLLETHENLLQLDSDLITLEKNPTEKKTLAQIFRTLHSVKGTAGFLGLVKLQAVAHSAESLLSRLRAGERRFNLTIATALLKVVDAIREMLASIESSGTEGTVDYAILLAEVDRLRESEVIDEPSASPENSPSPVATVASVPGPEAKAPSNPDGVIVQTVVAPPPPMMASVSTDNSAPERVSVAAASSSVSSANLSETIVSDVMEPRTSSISDSNIRVDVGLLDKLMTLVGELVLARNQIMQYSSSHEDDSFLGPVQRLNLLTSELQASVMKTRMQPIGNVLNKFPRIVRDLALACGKKVRFEMDGQETELDKTLIEAIRDPLTHMVRNAIDHGIETPEARSACGKPAEGRLRIEAFHEGGKVIIEIADDGRGIDVARVSEKAINAKLVSPEAVATMSRQEILRLVFLPGFSTADQVTQFSGRGVGMDVVRTNIEKIGGTVDLESIEGGGTTIRTKIPLTLAIIPALIIVGGGERYAIPQVSLLELVRLDPEQALRGIERMHGVPVYRLRGALLPLVFLDEQFQLDMARSPAQDLNIVVLQADDRPFGLVVDAIRDTEEIVVKPLQKQLKGINVFSGAAIMGDGMVALVLDVLGLAQRARVISGAKNRALGENEQATPRTITEGEAMLFFEPREGGRMAIPLSLVARLEEFPRSLLENLGTRQVVQYRGEIMPLVDVSQELEYLRVGGQRSVADRMIVEYGEPGSDVQDASSSPVSVVVCGEGDQRVGLMVGRILDIVRDQISSRSRANRPGVLYTAVIQEKVTEFIDVAALVRTATMDFPQPAL